MTSDYLKLLIQAEPENEEGRLDPEIACVSVL